jgi:hypothetical protein
MTPDWNAPTLVAPEKWSRTYPALMVWELPILPVCRDQYDCTKKMIASADVRSGRLRLGLEEMQFLEIKADANGIVTQSNGEV